MSRRARLLRLLSASLLALAVLPAACGDAASAPTVLLVTLDTTRADRLGAYGRPAAATPVLDDLAARGVRFERAYSVAPITLPAHTSLLTALVPPVHGLRDNGAARLAAGARTAAEHFAEQGWRTGAFVASFPLEAGFGLDQGFEVYDDELGAREPGAPYHERPAQAVVDAALRWLPQVVDDEPLFLWVHLFDPHRPWRAPGAHGADDAAYQAEISHADAQLGRLLDALAGRGRGADLTLAVVADHGEGLGEHGEGSHAVLVHDATLRVPLILVGPNVPAGEVVQQPVSVVDVLPTLLALRGLPPLPDDVQGRDLSAAWSAGGLPPRAVYGESLYPELHHGWSRLHAWIDGDTKLVVAPGAEAQRWQLFDLSTDPRELHDLSAQRAGEARALAARLEAWSAKLPEPLVGEALDADREQVDAALAALGYVGADAAPPQQGAHPQQMIELMGLYHPARVAARAGQLDRARELLDEIEAGDPGGLMALELRAEIAAGHGPQHPDELQRAVELFEQAIARAPTRRGLWRSLSQVQVDLGRWEQALASFERALSMGAPGVDLLTEQEQLLDAVASAAFAAEDAGDLDRAAELLQLVLARRPEDAATRAALARVERRGGGR